MKWLLTSVVSVSIGFPAAACEKDSGNKVYGDVPLKFSNIDPRLSDLGLKLKPDSKNGWKLVDMDASVYYFKPSASGQAEPCIDIPGLGENGGVGTFCGKQQIEALRVKLTKPGAGPAHFYATDKKGRIGEILFTYPPSVPAIYIKSESDSGGRLLKISSDLRNLDNSNYSVGMDIEAQNGSTVVGRIRATRVMAQSNGEFRNPATGAKCFSFPATESHGAIEMQGVQTIAANADGNISSVKLGQNGAQVVGYRSADGLAPAPATISDSP